MNEIPDILLRIVEQRKTSIAQQEAEIRSFLDQERPNEMPPDRGRRFIDRLSDHQGRAIIAEVKMGSPSLGNLGEQLDPEGIARTYAQNGAAAISVVTEPDFFFGSYEILARCHQSTDLPGLAKDFFVHPLKIELARYAGASALLVIAALHSGSELLELAQRISEAGLVPLIECHNLEDVAKLGEAEWPLVGVNNRNLHTFEVDLRHSIDLMQALPTASLKVAESGLSSRKEIETLAEAGFDAFLIGESLLLSDDPGAKLTELGGVMAS
jgi:indole-3-glycerol phosphate synthase